MRNRAVASRYAQALLATAKKGDVLDGVVESYAGVMQVMGANENLQLVLTGPQIDEAKKKDLVNKALEKARDLLLKSEEHQVQTSGLVTEISPLFVVVERMLLQTDQIGVEFTHGLHIITMIVNEA